MKVEFEHKPHPHSEARRRGLVKPTTTDDERAGLNDRIGLFITTIVGTMWCAYLFTIIALVSLPDAIHSGDTIVIVAWIAQTFLQLALLPIIIVGQNIQARASDARAVATYNDADAVLHEARQIQDHLRAQDTALSDLLAEVRVELASLHTD